MLSSDEIRNWATVYAALVATAAFLWNVVTYLRNRPTLIVNGRLEPHPLGLGLPHLTLRLDITNSSTRKITVVALGYIAKSHETTVTFDQQAYISTAHPFLPKTLGESEPYDVYIYDHEVPPVDDLKYLIAKDSTGRIYKSRKMPLVGNRPNIS